VFRESTLMLLAATCSLSILSGCERSAQSRAPTVPPQDPLWSSTISYHTSGPISRRDKIRVVFASDVVPDDQVGRSAAAVLRVEPTIDGSVRFASAHEILLVPERDLPPGRAYRVSLKRGDLIGIPEGLDEYDFLVQVMKQEFEVGVTGLGPDPENDARMVLHGVLATADVEDADRIEQTVSAQFLDEPLAVTWQHDPDGRHHEFTVGDIARQAQNSEVQIAWDGASIGVSSKGQRTVEVPAANAFKVTKVEAVQDQRQYVVVHFSDQLDPHQNLSGLVALSTPGFTTSIRDNTIRLMSQQQLAGRVTVTLAPGIRSTRGYRLEDGVEEVVTFASNNPAVRFAGRGVVLPDNDVLSVPFEAVNVQSVQVAAFRIFEANVGQFLQNNKLDGGMELGRVGRYLWRKTIPLAQLKVNEWNRYSLDVTDLVREYPGGMFRLTLSINRGNSSYNCTEEENRVPVVAESPIRNLDDFDYRDVSSWDYAESYYNVYDQSTWQDRRNPCKDAYYHFGEGVSDSRNFLASNIGMVVKRDQRGEVLVATTNLRTAEPMSDVAVTFMNFQDQPLGEVTTNAAGIGRATLDGVPFYAVAEKGAEKGYVKVNPGTALPTSHFDVGGETVTGGLKGFIYGERGVWRPGDAIHLTFVLEDQRSQIPSNHPVSMRLFNPNGQLIQSLVNSTPTNGFYTFEMGTAEDAVTGNWMARAEVGGSSFSKPLKIETVIPNRLRVELDFGDADVLSGDQPLSGSVASQWLNGAIASNLRADVEARLTPFPTTFTRFADFSFDDPAREFSSEPEVLFDGRLDARGRAEFQATLAPSGDPPGMLTAHFTTRVFENSGAFSTNVQSFAFSPYSRYVGLKLPKGDEARGMLLTDTTHTVEIATLSREGEPVSVNNIQLTLYKIDWKWWWDRSGESLAQYATSEHHSVVMRDETSTLNGKGTWEFEIKYPAWGRYLLRACDVVGRHCAGKVFYVDWPGWAGRPQEQAGAGANVLSFFADKQAYTVGEIAEIELPEATQGRALVTIENGTRILEQRWVEFGESRTRFEVPISQAMSPNVYVAVTLIQPHAGRTNDRPIRMYGTIPLLVNDPATRLEPVIESASEWRPESQVSIDVSEASGRRMTYTLAVVDEGLLGLTNFQTPDLHAHFYQKEALGVTTWDIFDDVVGAYGGELERLLALGGGGEAEAPLVEEEKSRFPPVVRFLGPFTLRSGAHNTHSVTLPEYIGAVRVVVVAGDAGAYGSASKSVFVREPLSLLATLPRVIGPDEELTVPVTVFAMDETIRTVTLTVEPDEHFTVVGNASTTVDFQGVGEKLAFLRVNVGSRLGQGRLQFTAMSGAHRSHSETYIDVRSSNPMTVRQIREEIAPSQTWSANVVPHGLPGTNTVSLELTTLPPLNLEGRLPFLIRYPHGCLEQVTSAVFPQLYLPSLVRLEDDAKSAIEENVQAGIDRLRGFQIPTGAFVYWPGGFVGDGTFGGQNSWVTSYAGHFLIEAEKLGYYVPPEMISDWTNFQKSQAQSWSKGGELSALDQAYRLYTLALAGRAEMGAMNRLRESGDLNNTARWQLAAAYRLAGVVDVATDLARSATRDVQDYAAPGPSFGSLLRDEAIVLSSLVTLDRRGDAQVVAQEISDELFSDQWYSTHALAYALLAMSKYYGASGGGAGFTFERRLGDASFESITANAPIYSALLEGFPEAGQTIAVNNTSGQPLYGSIVLRGVPAAGSEIATSSGLSVRVSYTDAAGGAVDVTELSQGTDFIAMVSITNETRANMENLALEHMVPAGWEIHNPRFAGEESAAAAAIDYQDIRDDRIYTYFPLKAGETKSFVALFNAAYLGRYYLPSVAVEAMYDATKQARTTGRWVSVVPANR